MRPLAPTGDFCLDTRRFQLARIGLAVLAMLIVSSEAADCEANGKRRITVRDTIEMTEFADRGYFLGGAPASPIAIFSPDGKQFLIRLKKGDVERNVVQYWLLLFQTNEAFHSPSGRVVVSMESSSNREAIEQVRWLDNESITFLGENPGETPQVFRVNVSTKRVVQLTRHLTAVVSYDISRDGREIVFEALPTKKKLIDSDEVRKHGVMITSETVDDLLENGEVRDGPWTDRELYVQGPAQAAVRIPSRDFLTEYLPLVLSPDGRYAVLAVYLSEVPGSWSEYEDKVLHHYIVERRKPGTLSNVQQFMLLDVEKGCLTPLVDAPKAWLDEGIAWAEDGKSVILSGTYLPLESVEPHEASERRAHPFVVEVDVSSRAIHEITGEPLRVSDLDGKAQRLSLAPGYSAPKGPSRTFRRVGGKWRLDARPTVRKGSDSPIEVALREDKNTPPKIFVKKRADGKTTLLLDLNPQFAGLEFARVETAEWKASDGHKVRGGLYFPPDYQPGKRYPLVIQTHGYEEDRFWINGPWNSAFAAQPLAAQGIMVLQVGDSTEAGEDRKYTNTPNEGPRRMAAFEGAIDELDRQGLIDRDRVGLIGFSRTVFHVAFTLTHSKYQFRAASMADGFEGGYLSYLLWRIPDYAGVNGAEPVGTGLQSWLERSPAFAVENVSAPVRLEYYGPNSFLGGWQWFELLSELGKPVEFLWIPRGTHLLVKPWERMASQQGNVDWFRFWLSPEEGCAGSKETREAGHRGIKIGASNAAFSSYLN